MKKQVLLKTMIVVTFIIATSFFVTCEGFLGMFQEPDTGDEWTDVEYDVIGAPGNQRVKAVTVYLKPDNVDLEAAPGPGTYGVKKSAEQRRIERALTLEGARMSHDYFEAVFTADGTTIKRAVWEIGQPAGISGVARGAAQSYTGVGGATLGTAGASSSIIFVGRKTGKTLLGVGYMTHINNKVITGATPAIFVDSAAESVTFTVSPLATWVGFTETFAGGTTVEALTVNRTDITPVKNGVGATFVTNTSNPAAGPAENLTTGKIIRPRVAGAAFPIFNLPSVKTAVQPDAKALYKVGGLTNATTNETAMPDLSTAVRIWGGRAVTDTGTYPPALPAATNSVNSTTGFKGGLQWIKRVPAFMVAGTTYEITDTVHDKITKIDEGTTALAAYPGADAPFPVAGLPVWFTQFSGTKPSYGIFAITFQVPVFALHPARANNAGELAPEKWWIRPDYNQYQYLLDNGSDSGGAVLLGTDVSDTSGDWLWIYTTGIGFDNE